MYSKPVYVTLFGVEISFDVMCTPEISDQELANRAKKLLLTEVAAAIYSTSRMD